MIDERQRKSIELMVSGEYTVTEIAELVGVHRTTIYNWLDKEEYKTELDKRLQEIKHQAEQEFNKRLLVAIDEYWKIAMSSTDMRTKEKALSYWIDRSLGRTTAKMEMTDNKADADVSEEDVLSAIDQIDEAKEDNVIRLAK